MTTKQIQPVIAYANGKRMTAEQVNVVSVSDNLFDTVILKHTLYNALGAWAGEACNEFQYEVCEAGLSEYIESEISVSGGIHLCKWDASPEGAYKIVAQALGFEFVPSIGKDFFEV